jgi:hypothetical protein
MSFRTEEDLLFALGKLRKLGYVLKDGRLRHPTDNGKGFKVIISADVSKYQFDGADIEYFALTKIDDWDLDHNARHFKTEGFTVDAGRMIELQSNTPFPPRKFRRNVFSYEEFQRRYGEILRDGVGAYISIKSPTFATLIYDVLVVARTSSSYRHLKFALCTTTTGKPTFIVVTPPSYMKVTTFINMTSRVIGLSLEEESHVRSNSDDLIVRKLNGSAKIKLIEKDRICGKLLIDLLAQMEGT